MNVLYILFDALCGWMGTYILLGRDIVNATAEEEEELRFGCGHCFGQS